MNGRSYTRVDNIITALDQCLLSGITKRVQRPYPASGIDCQQETLTVAESHKSQALMRVNHAGEVSAQALYRSQALTARDTQVCQAMQQAAEEEVDHRVWCQRRLNELGGSTSVFDPIWFVGSFSLGTLVGLCGDKWSLAFVAETERQVVVHLNQHLQIMSLRDLCSRAVLEQMREDEAVHASNACAAGAVELPTVIKKLMAACAKVMTSTAYWL